MTETVQPAIEAQHLSKIFRDFWHRPKVRAVQDLSFTVQPGEVFGLLGPNGSGKSTTLKLVLGLLHPTQGSLRVLGRSPRDVKTKARIGYLPEESYLYPYLTSEETLDFYGRLCDLNAAERHERIEQLLDMIGLRHARRRLVGEFSKGMSRRIGLAQALINDPDLVILDEPTSGLDPIGCRQVKDLILTLARRGKTILLSSHLLADVEDVCDRIVILYNGRTQASGPIHDLLEVRSRCRITLPELSPVALKQVLAAMRELLGAEPDVDHPKRDLEQFFLEVVEKARRSTTEASGVGASQGVARYLSQPEDRRDADILNRLAAPKQPSSSAQEPLSKTTTEPPAPDANRALEKLTRPTEPPKPSP
jgi:ABC-2 type transport system ATP-binding protein